MNEQLELNLALQIRDAYVESNRLAAEARGVASQAIAKALECGQLLLQQKQSLSHGGWLSWLDTNLPEISESTARRYMALAKRSCVTDLNESAPLQQAYLAIGILPAPVKKNAAEPHPNKPWVRFARFLDGFRLWFNKRIEEDPLDTWPESSRRILKNELRWFAELYNRL